ncbi:hypothetical protein D3C76_1844090 [compost metagenome]
MHFRGDIHHLDLLQQCAVALHLLACGVDAVPLEFSALQGLAGSHRLEQINGGGVDFLGERKR